MKSIRDFPHPDRLSAQKIDRHQLFGVNLVSRSRVEQGYFTLDEIQKSNRRGQYLFNYRYLYHQRLIDFDLIGFTAIDRTVFFRFQLLC